MAGNGDQSKDELLRLLKEQCKNLTKQNEVLTIKVNSSAAQILQLKTSVREAPTEKALEDAQTEATKLRRDNERFAKEKAKLTKRVTYLTDTNKTLRETRKKNKAKIDELNKSNVKALSAIKSASEMLKAQNREKIKLKRQLVHAQSRGDKTGVTPRKFSSGPVPRTSPHLSSLQMGNSSDSDDLAALMSSTLDQDSPASHPSPSPPLTARPGGPGGPSILSMTARTTQPSPSSPAASPGVASLSPMLGGMQHTPLALLHTPATTLLAEPPPSPGTAAAAPNPCASSTSVACLSGGGSPAVSPLLRAMGHDSQHVPSLAPPLALLDPLLGMASFFDAPSFSFPPEHFSTPSPSGGPKAPKSKTPKSAKSAEGKAAAKQPPALLLTPAEVQTGVRRVLVQLRHSLQGQGQGLQQAAAVAAVQRAGAEVSRLLLRFHRGEEGAGVVTGGGQHMAFPAAEVAALFAAALSDARPAGQALKAWTQRQLCFVVLLRHTDSRNDSLDLPHPSSSSSSLHAPRPQGKLAQTFADAVQGHLAATAGVEGGGGEGSGAWRRRLSLLHGLVLLLREEALLQQARGACLDEAQAALRGGEGRLLEALSVFAYAWPQVLAPPPAPSPPSAAASPAWRAGNALPWKSVRVVVVRHIQEAGVDGGEAEAQAELLRVLQCDSGEEGEGECGSDDNWQALIAAAISAVVDGAEWEEEANGVRAADGRASAYKALELLVAARPWRWSVENIISVLLERVKEAENVGSLCLLLRSLGALWLLIRAPPGELPGGEGDSFLAAADALANHVDKWVLQPAPKAQIGGAGSAVVKKKRGRPKKEAARPSAFPGCVQLAVVASLMDMRRAGSGRAEQAVKGWLRRVVDSAGSAPTAAADSRWGLRLLTQTKQHSPHVLAKLAKLAREKGSLTSSAARNSAHAFLFATERSTRKRSGRRVGCLAGSDTDRLPEQGKMTGTQRRMLKGGRKRRKVAGQT